MRVLMILAGVATASIGLFCSANAGYPFITVAFLVGLVAIFAGIMEILITDSVSGGDEGKHWVRIEGFTSLILGTVFLLNQITEDVAIVLVFGLWIMMTGLRTLPRTQDHYIKGSTLYYSVLVYGLVATVMGIYTFFNIALFNFDTLMIIGFILLLQGVNHVRLALLMEYKKPEIIKTNAEKLREAKREADSAKESAKGALIAAKEAKDNLDRLYKERDRYRGPSDN